MTGKNKTKIMKLQKNNLKNYTKKYTPSTNLYHVPHADASADRMLDGGSRFSVLPLEEVGEQYRSSAIPILNRPECNKWTRHPENQPTESGSYLTESGDQVISGTQSGETMYFCRICDRKRSIAPNGGEVWDGGPNGWARLEILEFPERCSGYIFHREWKNFKTEFEFLSHIKTHDPVCFQCKPNFDTWAKYEQHLPHCPYMYGKKERSYEYQKRDKYAPYDIDLDGRIRASTRYYWYLYKIGIYDGKGILRRQPKPEKGAILKDKYQCAFCSQKFEKSAQLKYHQMKRCKKRQRFQPTKISTK